MISPEDESVLSAYIDGELDPLERRAVESAMAADPLLSIKVQDLVAVRELVAELPHPTAPDVSPVVLERIQRALARPRRWKSVRRNLPWLATALATAAAVVLAIVAIRHQPRPRVPERGGDEPIASHKTSGKESRPSTESTSETLTLSRSTKVAPSLQTVSKASAADGSLEPAVPSENLDQKHLRSLIDDPRLQRVFLVTDQIAGPAEEQVASLVERATRHDFLKITISQGIVVDPQHPDRAVVFAVVLDETELSSFRKVLKDRFQDRVQDHEVDPAVALQLADIGQVVSLPAHPEARVTIPDERLAIRASNDGPTVAQLHSAPVPGLPDSPPGGVQAAETSQPSEIVAGPEGPLAARADTTGSGQVGGSGKKLADHSLSHHPPMRADDHHLVVLIWVTGPSSG